MATLSWPDYAIDFRPPSGGKSTLKGLFGGDDDAGVQPDCTKHTSHRADAECTLVDSASFAYKPPVAPVPVKQV